MDFPVTRRILGRLDAWIHAFAQLLPPANRVPVKDSFRWEHPDRTPEAAQVAKAVRAVSGLRAALHLADVGHTVECGTLLRTVADFSAEIIYLGEAIVEGRLTADQQRFVEQHFAPFPTDPDELAAREREYYIGRKDIGRAHRRILEKFGAPADEMAKIGAYLNKGYDSYVHGSNGSAMELYDVTINSFMLSGHRSQRFICMAKVSVAGKLQEFLNSLRFMAITRGASAIAEQIRLATDELDKSQEDAGLPCVGLR